MRSRRKSGNVSMTKTSQAKCPFGFDAPPGSDVDHVAVAPAMARALLPDMSQTPIEPGTDGLPTGRCLCGAVSFRINQPVDKVSANYDDASRRWTGGIAMTIMVRATSMTFHGWGRAVQYAGRDRDRRHCFCRTCGSSLFIRHVQPEAINGMLSISIGALDSLDGLVLAAETHVDLKPAFFTFAGDRPGITSDQIAAKHRKTEEAASA
jgi:hypothetical protein